MNQAILDFYTGKGKGGGRSYNDIMLFDDILLERVHDYIQWLFPTFTASRCQKQSPVLDQETAQLLRQSVSFMARYQLALRMMLEFWGIGWELSDCGWELNILEIDPKVAGEQLWATVHRDHNQLRLARVLESTRILGFEKTSRELFDRLVQFAGTYDTAITAKNVAYWYQAMSGKQLMA